MRESIPGLQTTRCKLPKGKSKLLLRIETKIASMTLVYGDVLSITLFLTKFDDVKTNFSTIYYVLITYH